jgi:hypothetical protein
MIGEIKPKTFRWARHLTKMGGEIRARDRYISDESLTVETKQET